MTDDHLFWKDKTLIVSLDSRKGGVGKSTVGLAIAQEWLSNGLYPAVAIDADLLGSELAETINPVKRPEDRYPMGILDLLTQSAGGNTHFDEWLQKWLDHHQPGKDIVQKDRLPMLELADVAATGESDREARNNLVVFPTLAETSFAGRTRAKDGLSLRFLSDDFGRAQIELRFATLLGRLIEKWDPRLIVVDGSPFHVGLGRAVETIFDKVPKFVEEKAKKKLEQACWMRLEILGVEPSEVATLPHAMRKDKKRAPTKNRASGWVLNRGHFRTQLSPDRALDSIPFEYIHNMLGDKFREVREQLLSNRFLHVEYSARYGFQSGLPFLEPSEKLGEPEKKYLDKVEYSPEGDADWRKMWDALLRELGRMVNKRWDSEKGDFSETSWAKFFEGAFS